MVHFHGYAHPAYADALVHLGSPVALPGSGGWLIRRAIPGTGLADGAGPYPLFACRDWNRLEADLAELPRDLVSVAAVIDPFTGVSPEVLGRCFPDRCLVFKPHFIRDLSVSLASIDAHHRRNVRQAGRLVEVDACPRPPMHLDDWCALYDALIDRHHLTGPARFSRESFARQLALPEVRLFQARLGDTTVGMVLFLVGPEAVYYHLAAYREAGYRAKASYALFDHAIRALAAEGHRWLDLGGSSGASAQDDGLARFKRGWSTGTRDAWFGGRILDQERYAALCAATARGADATYFPAYRTPSPCPPPPSTEPSSCACASSVSASPSVVTAAT